MNVIVTIELVFSSIFSLFSFPPVSSLFSLFTVYLSYDFCLLSCVFLLFFLHPRYLQNLNTQCQAVVLQEVYYSRGKIGLRQFFMGTSKPHNSIPPFLPLVCAIWFEGSNDHCFRVRGILFEVYFGTMRTGLISIHKSCHTSLYYVHNNLHLVTLLTPLRHRHNLENNMCLYQSIQS